jgi:hypothetical protein
MSSDQIKVILKRFEAPDEVRLMQKGRFELVHLGGMTIGRATYEPGWKWSQHVGPGVGATRCHVEHVGLVLSGSATARLMMEACSSCEQVSFFTFHLCHTIVGSWVSGHMSHSTFSEPTTMRSQTPNHALQPTVGRQNLT